MAPSWQADEPVRRVETVARAADLMRTNKEHDRIRQSAAPDTVKLLFFRPARMLNDPGETCDMTPDNYAAPGVLLDRAGPP
jgi:hypothetical protein